MFGSIVAFSAYLYVLKHARPALATSYAYVNPPVAVLFGVLLAGEQVGPFDLAGMAIILFGVAVITLARQKRSSPDPLDADPGVADCVAGLRRGATHAATPSSGDRQ